MYFFTVLLAAALVLLAVSAARACTTMGAGRLATADGSVLVSHSCDGLYDPRVRVIRGGTHDPDEMLPIYRVMCHADQPGRRLRLGGYIPQASYTLNYFQIAYPFMNEKQIIIGEFTWRGRPELASPNGLFYIENLEAVALARCSTARDAVRLMGQLAESYGYADGGETLVVGDPREAWVFEIIGAGSDWKKGCGRVGAHWAARRIPDDEFFVGANRSRLGVLDFDGESVMVGSDITALPKARGWWKDGEPFDYSHIFNPEAYGYAFYASRREWRVLNLVAPSQNFPVISCHEAYPFSVKPDHRLTVEDLMKIYSDHLEGTDYDLTKGLAAGPFGCPVRYFTPPETRPEGRRTDDWERSVALYRCSYSFVAQCRGWLPDAVGGVLWFGEGAPDTTVYVPIYCSAKELPKQWSDFKTHAFDRDSAWWPFVIVHNWAQLRWNAMYPVICERREQYAKKFSIAQPAFENEMARLAADGRGSEIPARATAQTCDAMNEVFSGWWNFAFELMGRFHDGGIMTPQGTMTAPGYPTWWLERVGFGDTAERDRTRTDAQISGRWSGISL